MGGNRAIGRPAGFIRHFRTGALGLVFAGLVVAYEGVMLLIWQYVRIGGHVTPLWQLAVIPPLVLGVFVYRDKWLLREIKSWWAGRTGEMKMAKILSPLLDEGYAVLHDLDIGRGNVDHVVIGPSGVYAVETKAWGGHRLDQRRRKAQGGAMAIRERLGGREGPYVTAVVALTRSPLPKGPMDLRSVMVLEAESLPDYIRGRWRRFDQSEVERIRGALQQLAERAT
jgi:hypothetical protein